MSHDSKVTCSRWKSWNLVMYLWKVSPDSVIIIIIILLFLFLGVAGWILCVANMPWPQHFLSFSTKLVSLASSIYLSCLRNAKLVRWKLEKTVNVFSLFISQIKNVFCETVIAQSILSSAGLLIKKIQSLPSLYGSLTPSKGRFL